MRLIEPVLTLGLILAPPVADGAQAGKVYRIGYLKPFPIEVPLAQAFRQGLREVSYVEGREVVIEARSAEPARQRP